MTEEGKQHSRRNAVRHGLTAETVIGALEDAEDYAAFEMAVTADFDATSTVERELVLRLASLLWRLRRATAIESGLFRIQALHLLKFRRTRRAHHEGQKIIDSLYDGSVAMAEPASFAEGDGEPVSNADKFNSVTQSFLRLANLPSFPLDRLSRYEATLWRQACQTLFALQFLNRARPRVRMPWRGG
ncbi:hypothetical protein [Bradyrhizobium sp. OAE829]|uniref:hypothetical protein n=1 Tax=Bradyrhizobium sp. OAE829 TaxID=2663807 RepID=UPI00178AC853